MSTHTDTTQTPTFAGVCLCCGVHKSGPPSVSRPEPYLSHDLFGGKGLRVRLVRDQHGGVHEIPA